MEVPLLSPKAYSFRPCQQRLVVRGGWCVTAIIPAHSKHLLSTYCMPTTILGAEGARGECKGPCFHGMPILVGETDDK